MIEVKDKMLKYNGEVVNMIGKLEGLYLITSSFDWEDRENIRVVSEEVFNQIKEATKIIEGV